MFIELSSYCVFFLVIIPQTNIVTIYIAFTLLDIISNLEMT
jgi:hypothetical protein